MAVCIAKSVGEFMFFRFHGGFISGQTEIETHGGQQKKENQIQNFRVESRK